jgi:hypothetical protein
MVIVRTFLLSVPFFLTTLRQAVDIRGVDKFRSSTAQIVVTMLIIHDE